ncbi:MAG: glycosyltransferase family 4 protein [Ethanoligenens sp.]
MKLAFLSTYPPRACGIATFTQDLVTELGKLPETPNIKVIAMSNAHDQYDAQVLFEIDQQNKASYLQIAQEVNHAAIDLLVVEHEYGIYGGKDGDYLLAFIVHLQIPFVVTLHTVLSSPSEKQRQILNVLGQKAQKVVTMAQNTVNILKDVYRIDGTKIAVIHHGVPMRQREPRNELKQKFELAGRSVVSTFGLLSPGKGLEYGIEAIAKVVQTHKDVLYLILGQTHPAVQKQSGETYRESLEDQVKQLHLCDNVRFVNRYLTKDEIIRYLQLSDVYMTPYLGKEQAVSGTLAYAVGYGRVIVSTPYQYAKEMLADGRGLLAEFGNVDSLAKQITYVLEHPEEKRKMEQRTLRFGTQMLWPNVAEQYRTLFEEILWQTAPGRHAV